MIESHFLRNINSALSYVFPNIPQVRYLWMTFNLRRIQLRDLSHQEELIVTSRNQNSFFFAPKSASGPRVWHCRLMKCERSCVMSTKVRRSFQKYREVTVRYMTRVKVSFKVSQTTLTAARKYTFIKGYDVLGTCQHFSPARAGRSTVHHFMTMITSTHLLLRRHRLTCMPLHSAANYFLFRGSCWHWLRLTHSATAFEDYFPSPPLPKKKSRRFNLTCSFFVFFLFICPNLLVVTKLTYKIKPQRGSHPFSSYQWNISQPPENLPSFHCKQLKRLPEGMEQMGNCRCGALLPSKTC